MATELSYDVDVNRAVADQSSALNQTKWSVWYLVQGLLGQYGMSGSAAGKWSTYYSCDSAVAGAAGDGVDRWTSTYTASKVVFRVTTGSNFSWYVLRSKIGLGATGSDYSYLTVSCNATASANPVFIFSKTAPTGGSTTARPTAPDEVVLAEYTFMEGSLFQPHYCHLILSTRGDFFFWTSYTGLSRFYSSLFHVKIQDAKAADLYPMASCYSGTDTPYLQNGYAVTNNSSNTGLFATPNINNGFSTVIRGRNYNGSVQVSMAGAYPSSALGSIFTNGQVSGPNESDGTYNEWYIPVYSVYPNTELKGRLPDIKMASGALSQCALQPNTPAPNYDYVKAGDIWFPWPAPLGPEI